MKSLLSRPDVVSGIITGVVGVLGGFLFNVVLSWMQGQVGFTAVVGVVASFLIVLLLGLLYARSGPQPTLWAAVLTVVFGFLILVFTGGLSPVA
ncbi:MAG: hypothetical protein ACJ8CR_25860, partial [Roseiflexaceae bacterium]